MIEFTSIQASAGSFSLHDIDMTIAAGECHVVVGPTGAGKTFLLETLIGQRTLSSGTIKINGTDISTLPLNERHISYVPQETCLFPTMTVNENLMYGVVAQRIDPASVKPFVDHLIDFFSIRHLLERSPKNLSGGEKQRVALVRALATKPLLLVLDEPFSAIDHSMREEIRRLIKELLEEFKTTTLIVTHDLDEACFLGNRISVIMNGRIVQTGDREDIYYYPKTYATASFLGIRNIFSGTVLDIAPEQVVIDWDDTERRVTVSCKCSQKRFTRQQTVRFGIRSESIHILRPDKDNATKPCMLEGTVGKIFVRGKLHTVVLHVAGKRDIAIEIDIHDAAARKIGIAPGGRLSVSLDPKSIFILRD